MNAHTPGPWRIYVTPDDEFPDIPRTVADIGYDLPYGGPQHVAHVWGWGQSYDCDEEQQANARLIASAPILLAACEAVVKDAFPCGSCNGAGVDLRPLSWGDECRECHGWGWRMQGGARHLEALRAAIAKAKGDK